MFEREGVSQNTEMLAWENNKHRLRGKVGKNRKEEEEEDWRRESMKEERKGKQ